MKAKYFSVGVAFLLLVLALGGCAGATTVTLPGATVTIPPVTLPGSTVTMPPVTMPGATITLPGSVTTLPPVTVTLPGSTTTIPGTTVTVPTFITTIPPETVVPSGFLPTTPAVIRTHKNQVQALMGECLNCHGVGGYNEFPTAPFWDGGNFLSSIHSGQYFVTAGSIQDHTGRTTDTCLGCHRVA